jgi:hypothetical protein
MGIGFSHCDASWSYSGFNSFRQRLAKEIGIRDLGLWWNLGGIDGKREDYNDPIELLLDHSNCEGVLSPEECRVIAPRLREVVEAWSEEIHKGGYDKQMAIRLADGMEKAAAEEKNLEFC